MSDDESGLFSKKNRSSIATGMIVAVASGLILAFFGSFGDWYQINPGRTISVIMFTALGIAAAWFCRVSFKEWQASSSLAQEHPDQLVFRNHAKSAGWTAVIVGVVALWALGTAVTDLLYFAARV